MISGGPSTELVMVAWLDFWNVDLADAAVSAGVEEDTQARKDDHYGHEYRHIADG